MHATYPRFPRCQSIALRPTTRLRPDIIHAIDFDTAWAAREAARLTGAYLAYDVFDFYAEMVTADLPPRVRRRLAGADRRLLGRADRLGVPALRRTGRLGRGRR